MAEDPLGMPFQTSRHPGPADRKHLMHRDYASSASIILLALYSLVVLSLVFKGAWYLFPQTISHIATIERAAAQPPAGTPPAPPLLIPDRGVLEGEILLLVICAGVLGGLLHLATSLGNYVGGRQLLRSWLLFYYMRPITGGILAVAVYLVLRMGVTGLSGTPAAFNLYGILTFSLLSGMFSRQAIDKLAEVFDTLFHKLHEEVSRKEISELVTRPPTDDDFSLRVPDETAAAGEAYDAVETIADPDPAGPTSGGAV